MAGIVDTGRVAGVVDAGRVARRVAGLAAEGLAEGGAAQHPRRAALDRLERAVETRDVLSFCYTDETGKETERHVRPLGLWFWGKVWTLVAWCELRDDFRAFRIDRIAVIAPAGRSFRPERGKQLADFYRTMEVRGQG